MLTSSFFVSSRITIKVKKYKKRKNKKEKKLFKKKKKEKKERKLLVYNQSSSKSDSPY